MVCIQRTRVQRLYKRGHSFQGIKAAFCRLYKCGNVCASDIKTQVYVVYIKQVTVAEETTSFGPDCFRNCINLTSVKISDNTTVISDFMFDGCKSLTRFDFPDSLVQIRRFHIPASVKVLGEGVFNQIPGVIVDFEIEEADKPAGFDESRDFTYAAQPVVANRGVSAI